MCMKVKFYSTTEKEKRHSLGTRKSAMEAIDNLFYIQIDKEL